MEPKSSATISRSLPRQRPFLFAILAVAVVIDLGTMCSHLIEGWDWLESIYAATQTVTTVGYGDIHPVTHAGRVFSIFFMLGGVGTVLYALTNIVQTIVQSELLESYQKRKRWRKMMKLSDHYIICGAGRVGSRVVSELARSGVAFVAIERSAVKVQRWADAGHHVIVGDATLESTLHDAGVSRARGLAACLPDDADNVYVVLTARGLNPGLHIVARAVEEQAEPKLVRAGANRVIAPVIIGGHRMAQALTKPAVADFMDSIAAENLNLGFEQCEVAARSVYTGKKLRDTNIRSELNSVVVAIRRAEGEMIYQPNGDVELKAGDMLVVIGRPDTLTRLSEFARGGE
jgi:voltage-gated potassium channel